MRERRRADPDVTNAVSGVVSCVVVQAGSIDGDLHVHAAAGKPVTLPYRFGRVPTRVRGFQARKATTELVSSLLVDGGVRVVSGLGGVGKTQLTAEYAHQVWARGEVALLVWVTAGDRDTVVGTYARLAAELTGQVDADAEQGAGRLLAWLATADLPWLVVLDDVQAPADLDGLWPPRTAAGATVVTTRRRDAALTRHGTLVEVGVFTPEESAAYLDTVLAGHPRLVQGAVELARAVGHLPLALSQSSAYLVDRGLTCAQYVGRFADRQRRLAELLPEPDALPDEHRETVAVTWSLSVEHADRLSPAGLARPLLGLCAVLDPNGIPVDVLTATPALDYLGEVTGGPVTAERARDGLACLHRLNLATVDPAATHAGVRVHALVQRATRDHDPARVPALARAAADAVLAAWPDVERDAVLAAALRANTIAVADHTGDALWKPAVHAVLFRAGNSWGESGWYTSARKHFVGLRVTATRLLGADHADVLTARHALARWWGEAGDAVGAVVAYAELLEDRLRVVGAEHPDTLTARHSLARWRGMAGDAVGAAAAFTALLADRLRLSGAEHPDIPGTRHSVAVWRGEAGDASGGAAAYADLLEDRLRVSGADHLDTLATRYSLARWRGEAGDAVGAVAAYEELLDEQLRVLGAEHPVIVVTRLRLARWRNEVDA